MDGRPGPASDSGMVEYRKIIVPTDFSECSKLAIEPAVELARRFGGEILLCHVVEPPIYPAMFEGASLVLPHYDEELRKQLETHLSKLRAEWIPSDIVVREMLREGSPVAEIAALAKEETADLIVVATHGHTGIKHALLGSVAEQIVRTAPCPVLSVRARKD